MGGLEIGHFWSFACVDFLQVSAVGTSVILTPVLAAADRFVV
jgi:hypothetical protein